MSAKPKLTRNTPEEEAAIQAGIAQDPDNPEWTEEDFDNAIWWNEARPPRPDELKNAPQFRRKVAISIRLDRDVLEKLRASGPGWQSRVNDLLRRYG